MRYNYNGNDARSEEELVGDTLYIKTIVDSDKTAYMYYSADGENWILAGSGAVPTAGSRVLERRQDRAPIPTTVCKTRDT